MAESYGKYMFNFLRNCQTVFQGNWQFCIPISSVLEFQILHILPRLRIASLNFNHSSGYAVVAHWGFNCISLKTNAFEHCLMCLFAICTSSMVTHFFLKHSPSLALITVTILFSLCLFPSFLLSLPLVPSRCLHHLSLLTISLDLFCPTFVEEYINIHTYILLYIFTYSYVYK